MEDKGSSDKIAWSGLANTSQRPNITKKITRTSHQVWTNYMTGLSPALIPIPVQSQEQWPSALQASYEVRENPHPTWECYLGRNHGGEKKCFNYIGSSCWGLCWGFMRIPPVWYGLPELGSFSASKLSKNQRWPSIAAPLFWQRQAPTEQLDTTNVPTSHADTHTHTPKKTNQRAS